jgi:type I restriction enzyme M protein
MKKRLHSFPAAIQNARNFRKHPTVPENILWSALRNHRMGGVKFRRQHPVDQFILDFFCREKSIAIEIDGDIHKKKQIVNHDLERTEYLSLRGITVLRFGNDQILNNLPAVLVEIQRVIMNK